MQREVEILEIEEAKLKAKLVKTTQDSQDTLELIPRLLADYVKKEGWNQIAPQVKLVEIVPNEELVNRDLYVELTQNTDEVNFNKILEKLGNINAQDKDGRTFLMHCLLNGFQLGVKKLLDMGADVNIIDNDGMNALLYSGQFPNIGNITRILENSTNVRATSPYSNNMNIAHLLVKNLASISWDTKDLTEDDTLYVSGGSSMVLDGSQNYDKIVVSGNSVITITGSTTIGTISAGGENVVDMRQKNIFNLLRKLHERDSTILDELDGSGHNVFTIALSGGYKDLALNLVKESIINIDYERLGVYNILTDSARFSNLMGNLDFFKEILKLTNKDCNIISSKNHTLIDYAAGAGDVKIVEFLVKEKNIDPKKFNPNGLLPFHNASASGSLAVLEFLKSYMADIDLVTTNPNQHSALHLACMDGKLEIVKKLISWSASLNLKDGGGWTALDWASDKGYVEIVQTLISSGADVNSKDSKNMHSLDWACINGHLIIAKLLIESGADINLVCARGFPPLIYAYDNKHIELTKELIKLGANFNISINGNRLINHASCKNDVDMVKFLVEEKNVNPLEPNSLELIPWHNASALGSIKVLEFLKPYMEGNIDFPTNTEKYSALHYACLPGKIESVLKLIEWGADINLENGVGQTPLYLSLGQKDSRIIQALIDQGANIHIPMNDGDTVMHMVGYRGLIDFGRQFIEKGMSIDVKNHKGETASMLVCNNKQSAEDKKKTLEFFIKNGTDIHLKNNEGKDLVDYIDLYFPEAKYLIDNPDSENGASDVGLTEHLLGETKIDLLEEAKIDLLGDIDNVDINL